MKFDLCMNACSGDTISSESTSQRPVDDICGWGESSLLSVYFFILLQNSGR